MGLPGFKIQTANQPAGSVTVTTSSGQLLAANAKRHGLILVNDGSNPVYLSFGSTAAVAGNGVRLNASGGSIQLDANSLWVREIQAIASGGSSNVTITEF